MPLRSLFAQRKKSSLFFENFLLYPANHFSSEPMTTLCVNHNLVSCPIASSLISQEWFASRTYCRMPPRNQGHAHRRLSLSSLAPGHHPVDHSVRQGIPGGHPADAGADASSEAGVLFEFSHGEVVFSIVKGMHDYSEFLKDVFLSKPAASSFSISVRWSGISLS